MGGEKGGMFFATFGKIKRKQKVCHTPYILHNGRKSEGGG